MNKKIWLGLLLGCSICIVSLAMTTRANNDTGVMNEKEPEIIHSELQKREEAAIEKYNKLLETWSKDKLVVSDVSGDFPSFYGGAYINGNKDLVVQITDNSTEVKSYFEELIGKTGIVFEKVEYSFERLLDEKEMIEKELSNINNSTSLNSKDLVAKVNCSGVGLALRDNSVAIYVDNMENTRMSFQEQEIIKRKFSSFENIKVIPETLAAETVATLLPGQKIRSAGTSRSMGFWAKKTNGDVGIVTAPHDSMTSGTIVRLADNTEFGVAQTPHFGGNVDAVFVKRTGTGISISNKPEGWSFTIASNTYRTLPEGASVYSSGYASGAEYGIVEDISLTAVITGHYGEYQLTDVVKTSINANPGDSGGIVAGSGNTSSRYVVGIISARTLVLHKMMYIKMPNISVALGVLVY